uniref:inositol monophosphatase family protein n=1 Tax=Rhizobium rhizogenes TaxID=359 RepID=UPI00155DA52E|nr:inositol monophosphatase family protein [Rhizobium rhizogenes]
MADQNNPKSAGQDTAAIVEKIARKAGERALDHFRSLSSLPVETKGHLDLVTEADKDVEAFLIGSLREAFPDDGIMGEESGEIPGASGRVWVIDPIDGTFNFVRGGQNWAISIGLYENRRPSFGVIYAPVRDLILVGGKTVPTRLNGQPIKPLPALDMSRASTGFSRFISDDLKISFRFCGAATLSMIEVAMGETDGYVSLGDLTWDVMAALPILGHLGISNTIDWDRIDLSSKLRFACGSEEFLSKVRPLIEKVSAAA